MKRISFLSIASLLVCYWLLAIGHSASAARPGASSPVQLQGGETPAQLQDAYAKAIGALAPELAKADGNPLKTFEATLHNAARPGAEAERAACCKAIAAALQTDAPAEAKAWMLKLVAFADHGEVLPVAAKLLGDKEPLVRESARYALQHNPAPEAADALRAALAKTTDPDWQAALVLALGARKDAASVKVVANLGHKNETSSEAVLWALGNIANAEARKELSGSLQGLPEKLRVTAPEAFLKCAEQMLREGNTAEAMRTYRELNHPRQPRSIRLAALQGTLKSAGDGAAEQVLELLTGDDADARVIAAGFISDLSGAGLKKLAAGMGKLPSPTQVMVLAALADRGEKSALPEALSAAKSADESVRLAGLSALARLGDASTVPVLVDANAAGGNVAGAARDSLAKLDGAGVNEAIVAAMQKETDATRRGELIGVLESRGAAVAVPALLQETSSDQAGVRRATLRALGKLAAPKDLPPMLAALLKSPPGGDRDEAERAVASVCARVSDPDKQAEPVLAAYRDAAADKKAILIPVLGRLGGSKSFEVVKAALASADPATSKAGETALANWPDADETVEAELLALAQRATAKPSDRASALRAYLRVISLPSGLPDQTKLKKFQKAMELAERDQERNTVLERVTELKRIETLRFVVPYLDQPTLCSRAGSTICELAKEGSLRSRNKAEVEAALNKIIAVCKDTGVVDRAKRRLTGN